MTIKQIRDSLFNNTLQRGTNCRKLVKVSVREKITTNLIIGMIIELLETEIQHRSNIK